MSIGRELVRARFSDGKWRTIDDMAYALQGVIAVEQAGRTAAKLPGLARLPLSERLHRGRRIMIQRTVSQMVRDKQAEYRKDNDVAEYRVGDSPKVVKVGRKLPPETFDKPAAGTKFGFTRPMLYQLVTEAPGTTPEALVARLSRCFHDEACLDYARAETTAQTRRRVAKGHVPTPRKNGKPPERAQEVAAARLYCVKRVLHDMKSASQVEITTVTTVRALPPAAK